MVGVERPLDYSPARIVGVATFLDRESVLGPPAEGVRPPVDFVSHLHDMAAQVGPDLEPIQA